MEKKPFDKAIKDSLKNLKVNNNAAHWQQMEMLLNNLPIGDTTDRDAYFDALIKNKISATEVPATPANWAVMEAALTQAETTDTQFDAAVNDKISNLVGTAPNIWAGIEQGLAAEEALDSQFDTQVSSKLQNLYPTYQPNHWQRLLAKLSADFALKEKLYQYKLLEATLMILLLLNFYQYLPTNYDYVAKVEKNAPIQSLETSDEQIFKPVIEEKAIQKTPNSVNQKQSKSATKANPPIADNQSIPPVRNDNITSTENKLNKATIPNILSIRNYNIIQSLPLLKQGIGKRSSLAISVSEMHHHLSMHTLTSNSLIATVPSLRPNFVESQYITPLDCKDCKHSKVPARLRLGIIANIALNNAYRAGGQILDIGALNQKGFGYGSGFSLGFKYGRWEIETGLAYAAKQYDPNIIEKHGGIVHNGGISQTHFQTIHLQTLHIPVNLRYNYAVLGKGKWHLYAQAGASLNVILRAEYDLAETTTPTGRFQGVATTTSRLSAINYNNGLLAGDGLKDNKYLAISMGAGVERYISPRWSIFVQPDFHFHFSGNRIGPIEDRINTLSLSFGARKSL